MIRPDFLALTPQGLYCSVGNFFIDPIMPVETAVISHAHADHAVRGNRDVYCTPATAAFMRHRYRAEAGRIVTLEFGQRLNIRSVDITFFPAGHILGSAQILLEHEGVRYLYTGDFKLQEDRTCETYEFVRADVLITESTFARPSVGHPDAAEEIRRINEIEHNVLLGAYSLGKAQRICALLQDHCPDRKVLVHHAIFPLNKIYESYLSIGNYEMYSRRQMKSSAGGLVYIVPPLTFSTYLRATNVVRAFASGWDHLQVKGGIKLMISDHADWSDILKVIDAAEPQEIWTLHGDGSALRQHFGNQIPVKLLNA